MEEPSFLLFLESSLIFFSPLDINLNGFEPQNSGVRQTPSVTMPMQPDSPQDLIQESPQRLPTQPSHPLLCYPPSSHTPNKDLKDDQSQPLAYTNSPEYISL